ncbi:MAG: hypothetical protein AABY22_23995 [Nanoarchaeota archaeon]
MKLQIIKKAWEVKDKTIDRYEYEYCPNDYWQQVYAESEGQAKQQCKERNSYKTISVRRDKQNDIVLHEGDEGLRSVIIRLQKENDQRTDRKKKVLQFPETEMFYIQKGYVGNSCYWWALGSSGYTTDLNKAQKYTRKEVLLRFITSHPDNKIWPASHVETKISKQVDSQYLNYKYCA